MYFPQNTAMIAIAHIIKFWSLKINVSGIPLFFVYVFLSYEFAKLGNSAPEPVVMLTCPYSMSVMKPIPQLSIVQQ